MKNTKTLAFNIDNRIADLIKKDSELQHSNESAVLRQIVFRHYENDPRLKAQEEKVQ